MLNVDGVECSYGSVKVIEEVSFSVKEGDFVGILGPNGSGKTTLLKSISRTLKPHLGTILLNEADIYTLKSIDVAKQLAVVPQESNIGFRRGYRAGHSLVHSESLGDLRRQGVVEIAVDFDQVFQPSGLAVEGDFLQRD